MELHQLRYFLAVARTCNFSRAAEQCHVAQPSLSQQIMKLEDELGERLFERTKREVALTPAGELFRAHAERVLEEVELARDKVREVGGLVRGRVTLGALPTVAPYYLPARLRAFTAKFPGVEVVVHEDTTAQLTVAVLAKDIDLRVLLSVLRTGATLDDGRGVVVKRTPYPPEVEAEGLAALGIRAKAAEAIVPAYLARFRPGGSRRESFSE